MATATAAFPKVIFSLAKIQSHPFISLKHHETLKKHACMQTKRKYKQTLDNQG